VTRPALELRRLLSEYVASLEALRPYGIENLCDYAEYAFEKALDGRRESRNKKGHDVICTQYGRVQVKERRLPADGRVEERLHLGNVKPNSCDYVGAVIFHNDYRVKKATLVAHAEVWRLMETHPDPEKKVKFDLLASLPGAIDMTARLREVLE
jgi:hypothetical protein